MSFGSEIVDLLKADISLFGVVEDNVYEYPDTGRKGLTRLISPSAFDEHTGLIKPVVIVLETDDMTDGEIVGKSMSFSTPINVLICDRGDTKVRYDNIIAAHDRIYSLLHLAQIDNACQVLYVKTVKYKRWPDLKDCALFRAVYSVHAYRTV